MSTITTRAGKGSTLTYTEVDNNFTNLNTDKLETVTASDIDSTGATDGYVLTADGIGGTAWEVVTGGSGISNVVEDTTPQLGGNLDVNGNSIVSTSAGNISITPDTTGKIILDGLSWPTADGTANYFLKTDGAGNLSWASGSSFDGNLSGNNLTDSTDGEVRVDDIFRVKESGTNTEIRCDVGTSGGTAKVALRTSGGSSALTLYANETTPEIAIQNNLNLAFKLDKWYLPTSDGNNGQVITTDGSGNLSFTSYGYANSGNTTDATTTTLATYTIPTNTMRHFNVRVRCNDSSGNGKWWTINVGAKNLGGTASIVGTQDVVTDHDASASSYTAVLDCSGTDLRVRVTGNASDTVTWRSFLFPL